MKTIQPYIKILIIAVGLYILGCTKPAATIDLEAYKNEIDQWKQKRFTRLTREDGWLTLCGLFWLKEGENIVGTDSTSTVILPAGKAPAVCGSIIVSNGSLRFESRKGVEVKYNDSVITAIEMKSDETTNPTVLSHGTVSFYVIKRGDQLAVRVKDKENPARLNFKGLEYFPLDPQWRFEARFEPYNPPKILPIPSMVGTIENDSCPGSLVFEYDSKLYRIDAVIEKGSEDQFFIMFKDETSGKETYTVGRQLYANLPDAENKVVLDFNKAYNWPCVFTEFATCPIPPKQNHLPFRVEAGEKMYRGH